MRELWINNELVDLGDDEPIALTKQVNKLNELKDRQADYSNEFSLPPTGKNLRICGFLDRTSSNSINPYTKLPCTYIDNGSELIYNGIAIIDNYTGGRIKLAAYSGTFDFFDTLGDKTLRDLDLSDADHIFNLANVIAGNYNDMYVYPLIQWGATDKDNNIIDIRYQRPCVKMPYLVDKIFAATPYNKAGDVFDLDSYKDLVLPVVEDSLIDSDDVLLANSLKVHTENIIPYSSSLGYRVLNLSYFGSGDAFDTTEGLYRSTLQAGQSGYRYTAKTQVNVNISIGLYCEVNGTSQTFIWVAKNGQWSFPGDGTVSSVGYNAISPLANFERFRYIELDISNVRLNPGEYIQFWANNIINIYPTGDIFGNPLDYSYISVTAVNTIELGQNLSLTNLVPEIKQKDLLKELARFYGLIPQVDNLTRTVNFKRFQEISDNKLTNYVNWSDKLFLSKEPAHPNNPSIKFRFDSYSQNNHMRYIQEDDRGEIGDGVLFVDDNTLKKEGDLFTSIFAASIQELNFKGNTGVNIKRYTRVEAENYNALLEYNDGDLVLYNEIVYEATQTGTGNTPTDTNYWTPLELQYEKTESVQPRILLVRNLVNSFSPPTISYTDGTDTTSTSYEAPIECTIRSSNRIATPLTTIGVGDLVKISGTSTSNGIYTVTVKQTVSGSPPTQLLTLSGSGTLAQSQSGTVELAEMAKIAYFADSGQNYDLSYQHAITEHYPGLQSVLTKTKIASCYFDITENEFKNIDFFKAVYVDYFGDYFYINVVPNFISGRLASVELVRL